MEHYPVCYYLSMEHYPVWYYLGMEHYPVCYYLSMEHYPVWYYLSMEKILFSIMSITMENFSCLVFILVWEFTLYLHVDV